MKHPIFNEDAGKFLSVKTAQNLKDTYYNGKLASGLKKEEVTRSEFFGATKIKQLLEQPDCVGIRIHYANRWEDEKGVEVPPTTGKLTKRLLLTGVDSSGRDLPTTTTGGGLKDDGDGGTRVVGDGYNCPQHCPNSN